MSAQHGQHFKWTQHWLPARYTVSVYYIEYHIKLLSLITTIIRYIQHGRTYQIWRRDFVYPSQWAKGHVPGPAGSKGLCCPIHNKKQEATNSRPNVFVPIFLQTQTWFGTALLPQAVQYPKSWREVTFHVTHPFCQARNELLLEHLGLLELIWHGLLQEPRVQAMKLRERGQMLLEALQHLWCDWHVTLQTPWSVKSLLSPWRTRSKRVQHLLQPWWKHSGQFLAQVFHGFSGPLLLGKIQDVDFAILNNGHLQPCHEVWAGFHDIFC